MKELQASDKNEDRAKRLRDTRRERDEKDGEDSGTETESAETTQIPDQVRAEGSRLKPSDAEGLVRKRRSLGEASGDLSTDSEWDKVEDEGEEDR